MGNSLLIVDDNVNNLMVLEAILAAHGYTVRVATSGEIALKAVQVRKPDLILLDVMMPGLDGFEVCRRLKQSPQTEDIPVLFLSAIQETEDKIKAFEVGGRDYITKPFAEREVLARVATHLRLHHMERHLQEEVRRAIAEKETAFEALLRSEERYRRIADSTTDYIFTVDVEDAKPVHTKHGEGSLGITGYTPQELEARPSLLDDMVSVCDRSASRAQTAALLKGGSPSPIEIRITRKDGKHRWVRRSLVAKRDERGAVLSFDALIQDISEQRELQEQLFQAQKMESIGQLAGGVAHDFNNILTVASGYASLIQMDPLDPEVPSIATELLKTVERGAEITRGLLAFSRKQTMEPVQFELQEALAGCEKMLRRLIGERIGLEFDNYPAPLVLLADKTQIDQVVMNLCSNARDAMPMGGIISIKTNLCSVNLKEAESLNLPSAGEYALLSVTDTGVGMDDETKGRVFEPFFTTKKEGQGTGLGVPIIYGIVKGHGGAVLIDTQIGVGTTFRIYLPIAKELKQVDRKSAGVGELRGNETILVIEDEQSVRDILRMHLERRGYRVLEASNGEDALRLYHEHRHRIQLLLIDVVMPGMSGQEVYDQVKLDNPKAKVLFMSGFPGEYLRAQYLITGEAEVIGKPITAPLLIRKVRAVLDSAPAG